jgi:molecular chaperone GrpE
LSDVENDDTPNQAPTEESNPPEAAHPPEAAAAPAPDPLAQAKEDQARLREQMLRLAADFDNFRKRVRKDLEDAERRGKEDVLREVLPVFDNLERAVQAATNTSDVAAIVDGLKMVLRLFDDHASKIGLTRLSTVGERFDPAVHDAIQQVETDAQAPGTVLQEIVPGYTLADRLLRPAMVVVARKPPVSA